jgi:protein gp37
MGETTGIGWTHHTFNPWRGCSHALFPLGSSKAGEEHPGCGPCYAEELVTRWRMGGVKGEWGPGAPRTAAKDWSGPPKWAREAAAAGERRRIFFSLGDPLDEEAPTDAQQRFWQLIRETADLRHGADPDLPMGGLDWLLLTKRPWRWELIPEDVRPLVWLGTSISDQATADVWVPALLKTRGFRLRFLSVEPLVSRIRNLAELIAQPCPVCDGSMSIPVPGGGKPCGACLPHQGIQPGVKWVIAGGMSGSKRQEADIADYQVLADDCAALRVAFYMKQDSGPRAGKQGRIPDELWKLKQVPEVRLGA